jgi:tetratricopeptide (TPR) repeat protein
MTALLMMTSSATSAEAFFGSRKKQTSLKKAEKYYENHEYYQARRMTQEILEKQPENLEAQNLMGRILDAEVERHKDQLIPRAVEEMNSTEKNNEVKTWLERSRALFDRREYDLALFAAEKVFLFDADNQQASELIDEIKGQALKEGKADVLFLNKMYEEEISERLEKYRDQAQALAAKGYFGQAKFTAEKILLLEPEDRDALKLYQNILDQEEALRHEA